MPAAGDRSKVLAVQLLCQWKKLLFLCTCCQLPLLLQLVDYWCQFLLLCHVPSKAGDWTGPSCDVFTICFQISSHNLELTTARVDLLRKQVCLVHLLNCKSLDSAGYMYLDSLSWSCTAIRVTVWKHVQSSTGYFCSISHFLEFASNCSQWK